MKAKTIKMSDEEHGILMRKSREIGRPANEIIRELIRALEVVEIKPIVLVDEFKKHNFRVAESRGEYKVG